MTVVSDHRHAVHAPGERIVAGRLQPSPETPQRAELLQNAAVAAGFPILTPPPVDAAGLAALRRHVGAVHTPDYLHFLETIHGRWQQLPNPSPEVMANAFPVNRSGLATRPRGPVGQAGYFMGDSACPIGPGTFEGALAAAHVATTAVEELLRVCRVEGETHGADDTDTDTDTDNVVYALCRPPGHHAAADACAGFCYLNNAAIAAELLRSRTGGRVAVLDVDLHHGNGTQAVFYGRADVLTISIHADPSVFYPWFWGHAHERGQGEGEGYNLNLPLALGSGDAVFLEQLDVALEHIALFAPSALVVALGLDAHEHDPLAGLTVTTAGFGAMAERIALAANLPVLLVQEGGYASPHLGPNLVEFLLGFHRGRQLARVSKGAPFSS